MKPYTLGIYEKAMPAELSWKEKMETAKAAGYDFIEISKMCIRDRTDTLESRCVRSAICRLKR